MQRYKVAVLGCGAIFNRHIQAIQNNSQHYQLIGIYSTNQILMEEYGAKLNVKTYTNEEEVYTDSEINCIVILTPSYKHYTQMYQAILNKKHVIVEKPATFLASELDQIINLAKEYNVNVYTVLQVRLNPAIQTVKKFINDGFLNDIRGISLVQRWQRPANYFSRWRSSMATGGGILREFGIHYLDAMQYLIRIPQVVATKKYSHKFLNTDVDDTIYALFDFGNFGGNMEVTLSAEPKNIECSLTITSAQGYIKLSGKSLDEIIAAEFLDNELLTKFEQIKQNCYTQGVAKLALQGASPYHPELYRQIIVKPHAFAIEQTYNVIKLIENIYEK